MDTSLCINLNTDQWISVANAFISFVGIVATTWVAIWLGRRIQARLADSRNLKDYFISEIIWIRDQYRAFDNDILDGKVCTTDVLSHFKLISVRSNDLISRLNEKYKMDVTAFKEFHLELLSLISECDSMQKGISKKNSVTLTQIEKTRFNEIQQKYVHIFNDAVIKINEVPYKK